MFFLFSPLCSLSSSLCSPCVLCFLMFFVFSMVFFLSSLVFFFDVFLNVLCVFSLVFFGASIFLVLCFVSLVFFCSSAFFVFSLVFFFVLSLALESTDRRKHELKGRKQAGNNKEHENTKEPRENRLPDPTAVPSAGSFSETSSQILPAFLKVRVGVGVKMPRVPAVNISENKKAQKRTSGTCRHREQTCERGPDMEVDWKGKSTSVRVGLSGRSDRGAT